MAPIYSKQTSAGTSMKLPSSKLFRILLLAFLFPLKITAAVIAHYIPYLMEITKQALLSITLIAGYLVNVKPEFPSQADTIAHSEEIKTNFLQNLLQDVAKQTGVNISSEVFNQLNNAGMHHDYQKLEKLITSLQGNRVNYSADNATLQQAEINPYALVPGIKKFGQRGAYSNNTVANTTPFVPLNIATYSVSIKGFISESPPQKTVAYIYQPTDTHEYSGEFSTQSDAKSVRTTVVLQEQPQRRAKNYDSLHYMSQLHNQHAMYAQEKALYEWRQAFNSVSDHFFDSLLREQLNQHVRHYKTIVQNACQLGASPTAIQAQTQIALQGLQLPGFLNEFSEVLQEKIARLCFKNDGRWIGIESQTQLDEFKKACNAYQTMLGVLSEHLEWENTRYSQGRIEELYVMDQGRDSWAYRFFAWMGGFFDSDAISLSELQSRITGNSFNQQAFTALELLEHKEFKLARTPLEHMARSAKTANGILLHHALLEQYQQKVALHYGNANISLKYQNDPVYWFYKPSTEHMEIDDPVLKFIEGHLAIRDTLCTTFLDSICKDQRPTPFVQNIAYTLIDKLDDPIAVIEHLEFLNTDTQNPEIKGACNLFYTKGVLNLFGLNQQASQYRTLTSDLLNLYENAHIRTMFNKLLLVDAHSEQSKRSLQLAFNCIPHACAGNEFSKEYLNILQAITQAHIEAKSSKGILQIASIPLNPSSDLHRTLLKAIGKAAAEDISRTNPAPNCPLTTREAWTYIKKVQDLESKGEKAEANALANTYLKGYIDEQMPVPAYVKPLIKATAAGAAIWWEASQNQPQKSPRISPKSQFFSPDPDDDDNEEKEESEEIKLYKRVLKEILNQTIPGDKTSNTKLTQYKKKGGFEDALKDFEKLNPSNVRDIPGKGKVGDLPGGARVNVRRTSSGETPTLEIQKLINDKTIKIRYM